MNKPKSTKKTIMNMQNEKANRRTNTHKITPTQPDNRWRIREKYNVDELLEPIGIKRCTKGAKSNQNGAKMEAKTAPGSSKGAPLEKY